MSNDYLPVFLYRWDDENDVRDATHVGFGESRQVTQIYPSTVIGIATRPVGDPIDHYDAQIDYEDETRRKFAEHVEELADDVRWFDDPLECDP